MGRGPRTSVKEVRPCAAGMGALDTPELPWEPSCSVPAQTSSAPSWPTTRAPPRSDSGTRPSAPAASRALPWLRSRRPPHRAPRPSFPPSPPRSPARGAAQRRLLPWLHCRRRSRRRRRRRARRGCAGSPGPGTRGPRVRGSRADPTAPRGRESAAGRGMAPQAGNTQPERPSRAVRAPEEAARGCGPGGEGAAVGLGVVPALEGTVATRLTGLPESGRESGRRHLEGPWRRAPPAPSGPGPPPSSAAPRGSGAVPAQSPRRAAPRPTPASARLRVT